MLIIWLSEFLSLVSLRLSVSLRSLSPSLSLRLYRRWNSLFFCFCVKALDILQEVMENNAVVAGVLQSNTFISASCLWCAAGNYLDGGLRRPLLLPYDNKTRAGNASDSLIKPATWRQIPVCVCLGSSGRSSSRYRKKCMLGSLVGSRGDVESNSAWCYWAC